MAPFVTSSSTTTPQQKGIVITIPVLVLSVSIFTIILFFIFPTLSTTSAPATTATCSCPPPVSTTGAAVDVSNLELSVGGGHESTVRVSQTKDDIDWVKDQIRLNGLRMQDNVLRKGINPRSRAQQLQDLVEFKGISHYEGSESDNHTALPCPGELLVEEHHSNYGEPWAGGRDVFEFLAESARLTPDSRVLEIGCGTLRVGLHFIRYLKSAHFHCLERDELSLMGAFRYELPSQGLLPKRPLIVRGKDMDFTKFGETVYDLIYASAVFLHIPGELVWAGLEGLKDKLKPNDGRIFVSHNIKFCTRLGGEECTKRLKNLGLEYLGKHTHDSLLFNHYEIWFEFRRLKA